MTTTPEQQICEALAERNCVSPSTVARWIVGGLVSAGGRFLIAGPLQNIRISGSPLKSLRFTCRCRVALGPDFKREVEARYVWTKNAKGKYRGGFIPATAAK